MATTHLTGRCSSRSSLLRFELPLRCPRPFPSGTLLLASFEVDAREGRSGVTLGASFVRICMSTASGQPSDSWSQYDVSASTYIQAGLQVIAAVAVDRSRRRRRVL